MVFGREDSPASRWCGSSKTRCFRSTRTSQTAPRPISCAAPGCHRRAHGAHPGGHAGRWAAARPQDADTKGDLFEHVLKQIKQAGELGQFRTPRHIIRAIVEMIDPKIGETIYDPAAGTAGFLVAAYNHIRLANSSPTGFTRSRSTARRQRRGIGDKLSAAQNTTLQNKTFYGNDVDPQMVRLATMNLTLRGLPNVRIL